MSYLLQIYPYGQADFAGGGAIGVSSAALSGGFYPTFLAVPAWSDCGPASFLAAPFGGAYLAFAEA